MFEQPLHLSLSQMPSYSLRNLETDALLVSAGQGLGFHCMTSEFIQLQGHSTETNERVNKISYRQIKNVTRLYAKPPTIFY